MKRRGKALRRRHGHAAKGRLEFPAPPGWKRPKGRLVFVGSDGARSVPMKNAK